MIVRISDISDISDISKNSGKLSSDRPSVVAIGNFDGLHLAHRALLDRTVRLAGELSDKYGTHVTPAVFTFRSLKRAQGELVTFDEKLRLIEECGIELVAYSDFETVKELSPEDFVDRILLSQLRAVGVVCGYNFRFGRHAAADVGRLRDLLDSRAILSVEPKREIDGMGISSTEIRAALTRGDLALAERLLGRHYTLVGILTHGRAIGREMGVPTLNLPIDDTLLCPMHGVYIARANSMPAIVNIGVRPTFDDICGKSNTLCEIHLLDDLDVKDPSSLPSAGDRMTVELISRVRGEMKFDSPTALYAQIALDVKRARDFFD